MCLILRLLCVLFAPGFIDSLSLPLRVSGKGPGPELFILFFAEHSTRWVLAQFEVVVFEFGLCCMHQQVDGGDMCASTNKCSA